MLKRITLDQAKELSTQFPLKYNLREDKKELICERLSTISMHEVIKEVEADLESLDDLPDTEE